MMNYSDFHVHTTFSDGRSTIEETVLSAIARGMPSIGISDHSFTEFDKRYCMKKENVGAYLQEIRRVGEKYAGQIEVYAGLEYDGYSELDDRSGFDYLIGDCHYVRAGGGYHSVDHALNEQQAAVNEHFGGSMRRLYETYFETYADRTKAHRPDILGHFDLVTKYNNVDEDDPNYRSIAIETLRECLKLVPVIEMNTGSVIRKWRKYSFPNTFLLKEILLSGGKIMLTSDSHHESTLTGCFDDAAEILRQAGFTSIVRLLGGAFQETAL